MISDALVSFIPIGAPLSLVGGAGVTFRSGVIDLLGEGIGVGQSTGNDIIGVGRATFGTDMGVGGRLRPEINVVVGVGLTGSVGQQLKVALQGAPDTGTPLFQPGTWTDIDSQDGINLANIAGGATAGSVIFRTPFIPTMPASLMPRFLSLLFSPMTVTALPSGSFTAGTILSATVTWIRDDQANKFANKNFSVA